MPSRPWRRAVCAVVGVVPNIARICERHQNAVICYEATRCLARTACGGDSAATAAVLAAGMFPRFMSHVTLRSAMDEPTGSMVLCEDALLALCKICELGRAERDLAVGAGILPKLTDILTQASRNTERAHGGVCIHVLRNTAYCAVVLFEERPELFFDGDLKGLLLSLVGLIRLDDELVCAFFRGTKSPSLQLRTRLCCAGATRRCLCSFGGCHRWARGQRCFYC